MFLSYSTKQYFEFFFEKVYDENIIALIFASSFTFLIQPFVFL